MKATNPNPHQRPAKRLIFDRRYGWIIDEWKHPSEEALAGGRGMFCIVPIAKSCFQTLSQSINLVAKSTIKAIESPNDFWGLAQINLNEQLQKVVLSTKNSSLKLLMFNKDN